MWQVMSTSRLLVVSSYFRKQAMTITAKFIPHILKPKYVAANVAAIYDSNSSFFYIFIIAN